MRKIERAIIIQTTKKGQANLLWYGKDFLCGIDRRTAGELFVDLGRWLKENKK